MHPHDDIDDSRLLLIVVGAHIQSEVSDRPLAYRLRERILHWQEQESEPSDPCGGVQPVVCCDLWYLNNQPLLARPTIAVGNPSVNAATAYLAPKLPTAFVIEGALRVHLDLEFIDLQACLWGVNPSATVSAIDLFVDRYLDGFLRGSLQAGQT